MLARLLVRVFVPGQAADDVAALLDRFIQQFRRAGIAHDAFLRKRHDLDVAIAAEFFAREQQSPRGAQSADRADVGEQPEKRRAVLHAGLDRPRRRAAATSAGSYLRLKSLVISIASGNVPGQVGPHDFAEQAFVGVKMQIEQAREDETSRRVDFLTALTRNLRLHARNPIFFDGDIDHSLMAANNGMRTTISIRAPSRICKPSSDPLEDVKAARAIDQIDQSPVIETDVVALHALGPLGHRRHEGGDLAVARADWRYRRCFRPCANQAIGISVLRISSQN